MNHLPGEPVCERFEVAFFCPIPSIEKIVYVVRNLLGKPFMTTVNAGKVRKRANSAIPPFRAMRNGFVIYGASNRVWCFAMCGVSEITVTPPLSPVKGPGASRAGPCRTASLARRFLVPGAARLIYVRAKQDFQFSSSPLENGDY